MATAAVTCLPVAVEASEAHCRRSASMPDCDHPMIDCCDAPQQESPALPDQTPVSRPDGAKSAAGLDAPCGPAAIAPAPHDRRVALAPPHGYRFTDLLTLNSVFLI